GGSTSRGRRRLQVMPHKTVGRGAPPSQAVAAVGGSAWLKARRPHGKSPKARRERRASSATQATPVNGAQIQRWRSIRREQRASPAPRTPVPSASSADRNSQGHWPTCVEDQARSGRKNARP